jgi:hypothetical protein
MARISRKARKEITNAQAERILLSKVAVSVVFQAEEMHGGECESCKDLAYLNEMDIPTTTQLRVHPTPTHTEIFAWIRRNTTAAQKTISRPLRIEYALRLLHLRRRWT